MSYDYSTIDSDEESAFTRLRDRVFISPNSPSDEIQRTFDQLTDDLIKFLNSSAESAVLPSDLSYSFRESILRSKPKSRDEIRQSLAILMETRLRNS